MRLLILTIGIFATSPAAAMMDTFQRIATSSSIPCAGELSESSGGGSVGTNSSASLTLTCHIGGKVAWVLEATAGCGSAMDDMPPTFCDSPEARPVFEFDHNAPRSGRQEYRLYRYVFAKDCMPTKVVRKNVEAVSNKLVGSYSITGYACKSASIVDGTSKVSQTAWQGVTVSTVGPRMMSGAPVDLPSIFGIDPSDYAYNLSWPVSH